MPRVDFASLPDDSRLWIFGATRPLGEPEARALLAEAAAFLDDWKAHGAPLTCGSDWRHQRFLLVAVDERTAPPSGCSIDAMVRVLKELETRLDVSLLDHQVVWYREGDAVRSVDRAGFRALAASGGVGPDTVVFDNTLTRLAQLRAGGWERPARQSWHKRAFFRSAP